MPSLDFSTIFRAFKVAVDLNLLWLKFRRKPLDNSAFISSSTIEEFEGSSNQVLTSVAHEHLEFIDRVAWRMKWVDTCLYKATLACVYLRASGFDTRVAIGVVSGRVRGSTQSSSGEPLAHAWLEDHEKTDLSLEARSRMDANSCYQVLARFPEPSPSL